MESATPLDATTGFHDIKPLPEFTPSIRDELLFAATIALVLALAYAAYRFFSKGKIVPENNETSDPFEEACETLSDLSSCSPTSLDEFRLMVAQVSLALRKALEAKLDIPAPELTVSELEVVLPHASNSYFGSERDTVGTQFLRSVLATLRTLEKNTYGVITTSVEEEVFKKIVQKTKDCLSYLQDEERSTPGVTTTQIVTTSRGEQ